MIDIAAIYFSLYCWADPLVPVTGPELLARCQDEIAAQVPACRAVPLAPGPGGETCSILMRVTCPDPEAALYAINRLMGQAL